MQIIEPIVYIGSNRRSDKTVVEWPLQLSPVELEILRLTKTDCLRAIHTKLDDLGCNIPPVFVERRHEPGTSEASPILDAGLWVAEIALALQQAAGHRVFFRTVLPDQDVDRCRLIFEHEHFDTGTAAGELAMRILTESVSELEWESNGELAKAGSCSTGVMWLFVSMSLMTISASMALIMWKIWLR